MRNWQSCLKQNAFALALARLHVQNSNRSFDNNLDVIDYLAKCSGPRRFGMYPQNLQKMIFFIFFMNCLVRLAPVPLWTLTTTYLVSGNPIFGIFIY